MTNITNIIEEESGCDGETVRRIVTLLLRELHRIAATDEDVTTAAIMDTYWNFGTEACYHLGGLLMYHEDGTNEPGHQSDSLVPETMRRFLENDEEIQQIRGKWLTYLANQRNEKE